MDTPQSVLISKEEIEEMLKQEPVQGKRLLDPLKSQAVPVNILEDSQIEDNEAEVHMHEADLWYCLEGEVEFVYGGEMVDPWNKQLPDGTENPNEVKAKEIRGGTKKTLRPGDWLWIPAGVPHQHNCKSTARLVIVKIPKKAKQCIKTRKY